MHSQPYKYFDRLQVTKRKTKKKKRKNRKKQESYVKFATKLTVRSKLDVNAFVKAKPDQIQRLLHRTVILRCHCALVPVRPLQPQKQQGFNEGETNPKTQGTRMRINERGRGVLQGLSVVLGFGLEAYFSDSSWVLRPS